MGCSTHGEGHVHMTVGRFEAIVALVVIVLPNMFCNIMHFMLLNDYV